MVIDLPLPPAQCDCTVPFATALPNSLSAHHHISRITRPVVCLAHPSPHPSVPSTQEHHQNGDHATRYCALLTARHQLTGHAPMGGTHPRTRHGARMACDTPLALDPFRPRCYHWVASTSTSHQSPPPPPEPPRTTPGTLYFFPSQPQPPHQTTHGIIQSACSSEPIATETPRPTPSRTMHAVYSHPTTLGSILHARQLFVHRSRTCRVFCAAPSVWSPLVAVS